MRSTQETTPNQRLVQGSRTEDLLSGPHGDEEGPSQSEKHPSSPIGDVSELILILNEDFTIAYGSPSVEPILGYDPSEIIGKSALQFMPPEDAPLVASVITRGIRNPGEIYPSKHRLYHQDGSLRDFESVVSNVSENQSHHGILVNCRVLSSRQRTEDTALEERVLAEALRETSSALNSTLRLEEVLDRILESVGRVVPHDSASIMLLDAATGVVRVVKCHGYKERGLEPWVLGMRMALDEIANFRRMVESGRPLVVRDTQTDPEWLEVPETRWIRSDVGAPIRSKGQVIGFLLLDSETPNFFNDTHGAHLQAFADQAAIAIENARLFEAERAAHLQADALCEVAATLNVNLDREHLLHLILEQLARVVSYDSCSIMLATGEALDIVAHRGRKFDREDIATLALQRLRHVQEVLEQRAPVIIRDTQSDSRWQVTTGTNPIRCWLGVPLVVQDQCIGLLNLDKDEPGYFTPHDAELALAFANQAAQAITHARLFQEIQQELAERKRTEGQLQKLSHAVEQSPNSVIITNKDGNIEYVNRKFTEITGYTSEEVLGNNPRVLKSGETPPGEYETLWKTIIAGEEWRGEFHNKKKNGELFWEHASISPVRNGDGTITHFVAIKEDISSRKNLEAQLRQAQKMEAIGRLAGGIAHDFNNLLTAINGYSDLVLNRLGKTDPLRKDLGEIRKAGERAAALTRQLLAFSRKQMMQPRLLDLNQVVGDMDKMLRRLIGEDIELALQLDPHLGYVKADPGQIEQVIMNLVINARDAMPHGGKLVIETRNVEFKAAHAKTQEEMNTGSYVKVAVTDTGSGMDPETQSHIFEPFFTTKEKGKGTGLGLSTAYGIIKQSGGHILVSSSPGHGSSFQVYLSSVEAEPEAASVKGTAAKQPSGMETILVVEDEEMIRSLILEILELGGYTTLEAANGDEALLICERQDKPIHLLLTDVVMPHLGGKELAGRLMALRPALKVLFMSGYTDEAVQQHGLLQPNTAFLQKPFSPDTLAKKIREVLDSQPRSAEG
jgi:PAS domain S-box-containing protein